MAVTEQLHVNLRFNADTANAKRNIQDLSAQLKEITANTNIGFAGSSIDKAVTSAKQLQMALQGAMSVDTGKLNIAKLQGNLKTLGTDITSVSKNLLTLGPNGQQAFMSFAKSISAAETPMLNINEHLQKFGHTLANTIKWRIATNFINSFSKSISGAITHAQRLNTALNDIRIVTGYSIDTMANFTVEANKAAQALNTTTTEYAKASLIFFQQGLSGDAVAERTEATIRLAQVTKESVGVASNQLTAIWNNFYDGTKSLEYYADAITALGAATASSSSEIATGLEKFAAIADTVGLSYEYATAALATVVAETRQSAEVIGTSFRTIFSRLEGLKLGETLDDGTSLNKYSQALASVGVQIKDTNNELRDADDILDDLGAKWQLLGRDQQVALAQTLGGTRQYAQVIAMMENWQEVQENVALARNSKGTLEKQANIWADSWEAASERVKQAQEQLYENFLNDQSIVVIENLFGGLIRSLDNVMDSFGGFLPMVLTLGAAFSNTLVPLMQNAFIRMHENIKVLTGAAQREIQQVQNQMVQQLGTIGGSPEQIKQAELIQNLILKKQQLSIASKNMTEAEKAEAMAKMSLVEQSGLELQKRLELLDAMKTEAKENTKQIRANIRATNNEAGAEIFDRAKEAGFGNVYTATGMKKNPEMRRLEGKAGQEQSWGKTPEEDRLDEAYNIINSINSEKIDLSELQDNYITGKISAEEYNEQIVQLAESYVTMTDKEREALQVGREYTQFLESRKTDTLRQSFGTVRAYNNQNEYYATYGESKQSWELFSGATKEVGRNQQTGNIDITEENTEKLADSSGKLNGMSKTLRASADALDKTYKGYGETLKTIINSTEKQHTKNKQMAKAEQTLTNNIKTLGSQLKAQAQTMSGPAQKAMEGLADKLLDIANNGKPSEEVIGAICDEATNLANDAENAADATSKLATRMGQIGEEKGATGLSQQVQHLKRVGEETSKIAFDLEGYNKAQEQADLMFQRRISTFSIFASTLGRVAMGLNAVKSIANVWSNEDASILDKITTTFMSLSMVLPLVTGAVTALRNAKAAHNAIVVVSQALQNKQFTADVAEIALKKLGIKVTKEMTAEQFKQTTQTNLNTIAKIYNALADKGLVGVVLAAAAVTLFLTGLIVANTVVTENNTKAKIASNEASAKNAEETAKEADEFFKTTHRLEELAESYREAAAAGKDYYDITQEIVNSSEDLIQSIENLRAKVILKGDDATLYNTLLAQLKLAKTAKDKDKILELSQRMQELLAPAVVNTVETGLKSSKSNLWAQLLEADEPEGTTPVTVDVSDMDFSPEFFDTSLGKMVLAQYEQVTTGSNLTEEEIIKDLENDSARKNMLIDELLYDKQSLAERVQRILEENIATYGGEFSEYYRGNLGLEGDSTNQNWIALLKEFKQALIDEGFNQDKIIDNIQSGKLLFQDLAEQDLLLYYKAAKRIKDMQDSGQLASEGIAEDFNEVFTAIEGSAESVLAGQQQVITSYINRLSASKDGFKITDIKNFSDFQRASQQAIDVIRNEHPEYDDDQIYKAFIEWGSQNKSTETLASIAAKIELIDDKGKKTTIQNWVKTLDEEDLKFVLDVDLNTEHLNEELTWVRANAELNSKLNTRDTLNNLEIKDIMTPDKFVSMFSDAMSDDELLNMGQALFGKEQAQSASDVRTLLGNVTTLEAQQSLLLQAQNWATNLNGLTDAVTAEEEANAARLSKAKEDYEAAVRAGDDKAAEDAQRRISQINAHQAATSEAYEEHQQATATANLYGLDSDQLEKNAKYIQDNAEALDGYSKSLQNNREAARESAKELMRYDKALETTQDKLEDWKVALSPEGALQDQQQAVEELKTVYSDLLDLPYDQLSKEFLSNADNLKLLEEAANGSEAAYEALEEAARKDYLIHQLGISEEAYNAMVDEINRLDDQIDGIEIGATIDDSQLLDGLTKMINACASSAEEAKAMLAEMGVDAEVTEVDGQYRTKATYTDAEAIVTDDKHTGGFPVAGESTEYNFPSVKYKITPSENIGENEQKFPVLKITAGSAKKISSGGNVKYRNATHGAGSGSAAKKSSGGGGGGGGGSSRKTKSANKEVERYHTIKKNLDIFKKDYDQIGKAADRAFGKPKLNLLDQQIDKQKQLIDLQKQYVKEITSNLAKDRGQIEAYGAIIDKNGVITNYESLMTSWVNKYNAGSVTDEEYDQFKEYLKQYEDTYSLWIDENNNLVDKINQEADLRLQRITAEIELNVGLSEDSNKVLDHYLKLIEDQAYSAAEAIEYLGEKFENTTRDINTYKKGIEDLLASKGLNSEQIAAFINGDDSVLSGITLTDKEASFIREQRDNLISSMEEVYELRKQIQEKYAKEFDQYLNDMNSEISKMEKVASTLDAIRNLIGLLGKTRLGITKDFMDMLNAITMSNLTNEVASKRTELERLQAILNDQRRAYDEAQDEQTKKFWQERMNETEAQMMETQEAVISLVQSTAEKAAEIFHQTLQDAFNDMTKEVLGFSSISEAQAAYDRYTTLANERLQDYQKIYELSKLTRQVEKSMSDTQNLKGKQALRDLQEEIAGYQAEGVQMTQYEVDYLQKKYELRLAEIALEDAQNAKSQVRLTRNADGGWGYIYTADQGSIDQAAQNYEDKLYALQQLNNETMMNTQSTILQLMQEREEQILALDVNSEDYWKKIEEINDYYDERLRLHGATLDEVLANNRELYLDDWAAYSAFTGYKISADQDYIDMWKETWLGQLANTTDSAMSLADLYKDHIGSWDNPDTVLGQSYNAYTAYQTQVDKILAVAGLDGIQNFSKTVQPLLESLGKTSDEAAEKVKTLATRMTEDLPKTSSYVNEWSNKIANYLATTGKNIENLIKRMNDLISAAARLNGMTVSPTIPSGTGGTVYSGGGDGTGSNGGNSSSSSKTDPTTFVAPTTPQRKKHCYRCGSLAYHMVEIYDEYENGEKKLFSKGTEAHTWKMDTENIPGGTVYYCIYCGERKVEYKTNNNGQVKTEIKLASRKSWATGPWFETGGYTGNWAGSEGRYAVLHSKELVLNKKDTKNILESVQLVRAITNKMDTSIGFNRGFRASGLSGSTLSSLGTSIGEQHVTIQADFPNATSRDEIREAIIELSDYYAQHAATLD